MERETQTPDTIRWIEERNAYEELIKQNIEYDVLLEQYKKEWLDEIVAIMVDVVCSKEPYIRINKDISRVIRTTYGEHLTIFKTEIPQSVRLAETSAVGKSIYAYDKNGKAAEAYKNFTKEVLDNGKHRNKHRSDLSR